MLLVVRISLMQRINTNTVYYTRLQHWSHSYTDGNLLISSLMSRPPHDISTLSHTATPTRNSHPHQFGVQHQECISMQLRDPGKKTPTFWLVEGEVACKKVGKKVQLHFLLLSTLSSLDLFSPRQLFFKKCYINTFIIITPGRSSSVVC